MRALIKKIYTQFFCLNQKIHPTLRALYRQYDRVATGTRWFYYGNRRRLAYCLNAESAPGTAEMVLLLLSKMPPKLKLLDYGCGQAKGAQYEKLGFIVSTCDVMPLDAPNFTLINESEKHLPYKNDSFDVCVASEVIEHMESPFELLSELLRVSRKRLIITTPNPMSLHSRRLFGRTGYLHWFTPADFGYHRSPIFHWQIERFCKAHRVRVVATHANHEAFGLTRPWQEYAESLILIIDK